LLTNDYRSIIMIEAFCKENGWIFIENQGKWRVFLPNPFQVESPRKIYQACKLEEHVVQDHDKDWMRVHYRFLRRCSSFTVCFGLFLGWWRYQGGTSKAWSFFSSRTHPSQATITLVTLRKDPIVSVILSCVTRTLRINAVTFLSLVGCPKRSRVTSSSSSCPPL
jgi:hypothetical protein